MKILVALDTSQSGNLALEETASRPWPVGSSIEVISVVEPTPSLDYLGSGAEAADRAGEVVRQAVARLKSNDVQASGSVLFGDPKRRILDSASGLGADFIIVGSRGLSASTVFLSATSPEASCVTQNVLSPSSAPAPSGMKAVSKSCSLWMGRNSPPRLAAPSRNVPGPPAPKSA